MGQPVAISSRIVEGLYCEALVLSDEVRAAFAPATRMALALQDPARAALSGEGLRTTTRMMHAVAWLLNHRAHFAGDLSEFQLRRFGRLAPDLAICDAEQFALLPTETRDLVQATLRFYDRLLRLDGRWSPREEPPASALTRLRERLERRLAG